MAEMILQKKPSFFASMISGVNGWVKGLIAGGLIGAVMGAAIGAVVALVTGSFEGGIKAAEIGAAALNTAGMSAAFMGSIGSLAGTVTEVVRSREAAMPSGNDIVNVAKISYAQGIATGHAISQQQEAVEQTKWRDKVSQERAGAVQQPPQVH